MGSTDLKPGASYRVLTRFGDFTGVFVCATRLRADFRVTEGSVILSRRAYHPGDVVTVPLACDIVEVADG